MKLKIRIPICIAAQLILAIFPASPAAPQAGTNLQHYVCNNGYTVQKCQADMAVLKKALARYPISDLSGWTWVLVRSQDWKAIVQPKGLNPDSPAFTYYEKRETFLEEALVAKVAGRRGDLLKIWQMSMDDLLDFAIAHELGHALCNEKDEGKASRMARKLSQGKPILCETLLASKAVHQQ